MAKSTIKMFYSITENWISELEINTQQIKLELQNFILTNSNKTKNYYQAYTSNNGWTTIPLYFFTIPNNEFLVFFPYTSNLIKKIPQLIGAEFSILKPKTIIKPHEGYSKQIMRTHLGLNIPEGDLALKSVDEVKKWEEGKTLSFNDGELHEAWNNSEKERWILMIDTPIPNSKYSAFDISKYKLENLTDTTLLSIASKEEWLDLLFKR